MLPINVTISDSSGASSIDKKELEIQNGMEIIEVYYIYSLNASYKIKYDELSDLEIDEAMIRVYPINDFFYINFNFKLKRPFIYYTFYFGLPSLYDEGLEMLMLWIFD